MPLTAAYLWQRCTRPSLSAVETRLKTVTQRRRKLTYVSARIARLFTEDVHIVLHMNHAALRNTHLSARSTNCMLQEIVFEVYVSCIDFILRLIGSLHDYRGLHCIALQRRSLQ